jgi:hypothetical protein
MFSFNIQTKNTMKKLLNRYITFIFLCSGILFGSCKKYINEGPIDTPTTDKFWTSQKAAESGLAGAYGLLRNALVNGHSYYVFGDATANEFSNLNDNTAYGSLKPANQWNFNYVPYQAGSLQNWTMFYQVISQCNLIIGKVPGIPASTFTGDAATIKNQMLGEAYFIRAYCYYYITQVWGEPVIVTEAYADPINAKPIARSTDAQGFAQAVTDAKKAISLMQYGYADLSKVAVQANRGTAFALLAKIYMWQKQYQPAANAADSVIQRGGYTLEPGTAFSNIFKGHSQESIFEMNMLYSPNQNEAQSGTDGIFSIFLANPFVFGKTTSWNVNTELVNNLYDTTSTSTDVRVKATFYGLLSNALMVKYANVVYQNPSQQTLPFVSNNMVLMRLADIYLIKAEANYNLGNYGAAVQNLNIVRVRAGIDPYILDDPTDLLYTIMDERGRELFGEGQWYFDLVRSRLIDDPNYPNFVEGYLTNRINNRGYLWPLDLRTLLPQDPLLTQNAWWSQNGL